MKRKEMIIKKIHHLSGLFIAVFVTLHLSNHFISVLGAEAHIALMKSLRLYYRLAFVETGLFLCLLVQIISGLYLIFKHKREPKTVFQKLQRITGLYLLFFILIHLSATLGARLLLHLDTNFYFGVAGLNSFPINLFFIPYYTMAMLSFFGHIACVHYHKMHIPVFGLTRRTQAIVIFCLGSIVSVLILFGLTNGFVGVTLPYEYRLSNTLLYLENHFLGD